jgi:lambda family phage portal protein
LDKIKPNVIDRIVSVYNPVRAAERMRARYQYSALAGAYKGASRSSRALKGWNTIGGSADSDSLYDLNVLRTRSSDLIRNSPVAAAAINVQATSIIGSGLRLQSNIDAKRLGLSAEEAKAWEREAEFLFNQWANSLECDASRSQTFYQMQDLVYRSVFERGDVFALLPMFSRPGSPFGLKIQIVEADRVVNENFQRDSAQLRGGVEKDRNGAPFRYHILDAHPQGLNLRDKRKWQKVRAFGRNTGRQNVLHIYRKLRPGQTRGIPALAAVIEPLKQLERYTEAELMAAVISGFFTVAITSQAPDTPLASFQGDGAQVNDGMGDYKLGQGAIIGLAPGEKAEVINPARPNAQFDPFVQAIIQQIGMALEVPYEILIKHFSASYSASQAAMLEAWRFFNARRDWIADAFCRPIYNSFIGEMVAAGRLQAPGFFDDPFIRAAYVKSSWVGRPGGHIREDVSIKAAQMRIDARLTTRQREAAMISGEDWETLHDQLTHEDKIIAEAEGEVSEVRQEESAELLDTGDGVPLDTEETDDID